MALREGDRLEATVEKQESIDAWFALVSEQAKATAQRLLLGVDDLRREETIYPPQGDILNALAYVAPGDVRAVILGQDPYHGPGQAMGLSFSVPNGEKLPPSLRNIYKEMASDLGCNMPVSGDLSAWAQQGVLLLNTTLTVREHEANSHSKLGWQVVTTAIVEACMRLPQPVVFLAWGRPAIKLIESAKARVSKDALEGGDCVGVAGACAGVAAAGGSASDAATPAVADATGSSSGDALACKFILKSTHPSPLSASRAAGDLPAFLGSRPFSRANDLLRECGVEPIDWALAG
ncbi:uracil-DNA glycosylase [uncultured Ellagibacter sp.]|uniref:uracil-DNA glycosylase n=1 Tax=uncultured Ellagibacter sp. TaxID=2137580 RepID=UPI0025DF6C4A|nr:uracil-DNA glycosylase [uncultured Ellagibacter sp.]